MILWQELYQLSQTSTRQTDRQTTDSTSFWRDIFVSIYYHDSLFLCCPVQPSSSCSVPSASCAILVMCYSEADFPLFLFSGQLLYYSLHVSRTALFLSSGSAILTCTGRRLHRAGSSATNSQTSEPSGKEASLHVTAKARFLFLFLQNSFQNSWLPSFRLILPRQYFKNIISFSSLFCPV